MDKFLLAENPMRPEQSGCFIISMVNPIAIIACIEGHEQAGKIFEHFSFTNSDGVLEEWTLSLHHFFTTDFISEPDQQARPLLKRAWRWYRAYMEWEDKNIDTDDYGKQN